MSYILVQYQKMKDDDLAVLRRTEVKLVGLTAELFNKKKEEIIVDFCPFSSYIGDRKILVRAETSMKNVELLKKWADGIKKVFENNYDKVGIKTYAIDSVWEEIK